MRNALVVVLSILFALATLLTGGLWWERALNAATFSVGLVIIVLLVRRFRRSSPHAPNACHVAAAIAVVVGVSNVITGVGHSVGVAALAWREPEYGPLQILRFTTGAMLLYSGTMNLAVYRAVSAGRRWAVWVGAATNLLFWLYLLFLLPLAGANTPRRMLGPWSVYLLWLGAAAFTATDSGGLTGATDARWRQYA